MKPEGRTLFMPQVATKNAASKPSVTARRPAILPTRPAYRVEMRLYQLLNLLKNEVSQPFGSGLPCGDFKMSAQSAGVRVSALMPDITIDAASVRENCR